MTNLIQVLENVRENDKNTKSVKLTSTSTFNVDARALMAKETGLPIDFFDDAVESFTVIFNLIARDKPRIFHGSLNQLGETTKFYADGNNIYVKTDDKWRVENENETLKDGISDLFRNDGESIKKMVEYAHLFSIVENEVGYLVSSSIPDGDLVDSIELIRALAGQQLSDVLSFEYSYQIGQDFLPKGISIKMNYIQQEIVFDANIHCKLDDYNRYNHLEVPAEVVIDALS
jgi:hypothetical protein